MTNGFTIAGILGMIIFILLMFGMVNKDLGTFSTIETNRTSVTVTQQSFEYASENLGVFGSILDLILPTSVANKIEDGFGLVFGALTFTVTGVPILITIIIWLFLLALVWMILELVRGV